jgi:DNA-binding winged helix-turn-helix (wHTH) protein/tetratricopeptide (TPR) repeat protein
MASQIQAFGEFRFVRSARELRRGAKRVELPRRTFECLDYLIANRERAVGRDELVAAIFGRPDVSDAQLGQVVLRTRRAVGDDGNTQHAIRTIAGFGYRWVAEVRIVADETQVEHDAAHEATSREPPAPTLRVVDAPSARKRRFSAAIATTIVLAVATLATVLFVERFRATNAEPPPAASAKLPADSIVVLPVEVDGLREDAWVRLGAMDLIADRLREAGMTVPPSESVLTLAHAEPNGAKPDAKRVRETTSARLVVEGKATHDATGWKVRLVAQRPDGTSVPVEFAEHDAIETARGASDLLLAALGHALPPNAERETAFDETLQRARAAMLANELDTARAILAASPELAKNPAELDYRLAQVDFRAGELDRADAALTRVLATPAAANDARFRAEVLTARGATRMRRGEFSAGGTDFEAAIALLAPSARLQRGQALVGRGNARVAEHRYDEALADFGVARVALESAGDALGVARVDANLGMLELYRGRPAEASTYLGGAADRFQSFGALREFLLTLTGMVDAELSMLHRDEAWNTVERGWALRERVTDPDQRVDLMLNRAQVLLGFGRYHEADVLLAQANRNLPSQNDVLTARARSLMAELALRRENWREAADIAAAALADWPRAGADADRATVVLIRQRALLALGDTATAATLLDRTREAPVDASDQPGSVADALAQAEWARTMRDTARSEAWFRHAVASADRRGVPAEIVAVVKSRAPALLVAGENEKAATLIGRVASWSERDFDCALLQLRLFHALDAREPWFNALRQAQSLAGEREIPRSLLTPPDADPTRVVRLTGT